MESPLKTPPPPPQADGLTAALGGGPAPPHIAQLQVLLLGQLEALFLDLACLPLGGQGLLRHLQVLPEHALLLPLPLHAGVLHLGALWGRHKPLVSPRIRGLKGTPDCPCAMDFAFSRTRQELPARTWNVTASHLLSNPSVTSSEF